MLTTIEQAQLSRRLGYIEERIRRIERLFQGQPLETVRFSDASITNAKVGSLSASKLTTGELAVITDFDIGSSGDLIRKSGADLRISMFNGGVEQLIIGMQGGVPVFKLGKDGVDADSNTNPDNFVLYIDQTTDYILIKEKARGTTTVSSGFSGTPVSHGLSYVPLCFAFVQVSAGVWRKIFSTPLDGSGFWFTVDDSEVRLYNTSGSSKTFAYYIFYDLID